MASKSFTVKTPDSWGEISSRLLTEWLVEGSGEDPESFDVTTCADSERVDRLERACKREYDGDDSQPWWFLLERGCRTCGIHLRAYQRGTGNHGTLRAAIDKLEVG